MFHELALNQGYIVNTEGLLLRIKPGFFYVSQDFSVETLYIFLPPICVVIVFYDAKYLSLHAMAEKKSLCLYI